MGKLRLDFTNSLGIPVLIPETFGQFQMNQSYLQSTTEFYIIYYGEELASLITNFYQSDLRCTVYVNDIPIVYGFISNKTISVDKNTGVNTKLHFRSLLGMLEKFSISPTTMFSGVETLDFIAKTVIYNDFIVHNEVLVNMYITSDVTKLSYMHTASKQTDPNILMFYGKVKTTDVQPKSSSTIYAFLQKLFHRNGLHMRDGVDKLGNPMIIVTSPQASRIDIDANNKIVNLPAKVAASLFGSSDLNGRALVSKFEEKIDNSGLNSHFIMWGQSYSSLTLSGSFTCTPNKVIAINPLFKNNPKLQSAITQAIVNYRLLIPPDEVAQMFLPDSWDQFIVKFMDRIDSSQIKPKYKQESEATTYQELSNKVCMEARMNLYNAYTLTYDLCNLGQHDDGRFVFYAPDMYVSVYDYYTNLNGSILWIDSVETNWSKQSGLTQKLTLKIPGTIVFEESTGINSYLPPIPASIAAIPTAKIPTPEQPEWDGSVSDTNDTGIVPDVSPYRPPQNTGITAPGSSSIGAGDSSE